MLLIGVSFGVKAVAEGWGLATAVAMSLLTFSGAAQIAVLGVLSAGGSVSAAVAAGLLVNLRFLSIGVAIGPSIRGGLARRALIGQAIVDASLTMARVTGGRYSARRLLGSTAPQWLGWQLGTLAGALAGTHLGDTARFGIDALFPAFFLVLLLRELGDRRSRATAGAAALIALGLLAVAPPGVPVIVACSAVAVGAVWR
jgi:4-azaleucine resistance transporter AzlC